MDQMKKIDVHAHLGYIGGWADVALDETTLLQNMDKYEMEKSILCAQDNQSILEAVHRHPGSLCGAVYVNPLDEKSVEEMDRFLEEGFVAVKLNPLRHAYVADDAILDPVMEKAQRFGVPVCIHCGHPPYSLPWSIALLAERFPAVKVVMLHMGHGHGVYIDASIKMALRYSNLYLENSGMPMHTKIQEAYRQVGQDRVMFGTDAPFHHPSVEIQKVKISGLTLQEQQDVFYNNAKTLFGL